MATLFDYFVDIATCTVFMLWKSRGKVLDVVDEKFILEFKLQTSKFLTVGFSFTSMVILNSSVVTCGSLGY